MPYCVLVVVHNDTHTHTHKCGQFPNLLVRYRFHFVCLFRFNILCIVCVSLGHCVVLPAVVVLGLVSSGPSRDFLRKTSQKWPIWWHVKCKTSTQLTTWRSITNLYTLCLNKKHPRHFSLLLQQALLDFNNFWQRCFVENVQSEDGIFSHLT